MTVFKGPCSMWYKILNHLSCMHQSHSDVKVEKKKKKKKKKKK